MYMKQLWKVASENILVFINRKNLIGLGGSSFSKVVSESRKQRFFAGQASINSIRV